MLQYRAILSLDCARLCGAAVILLAILLFSSQAAQAMRIEKVVSPAGLEAWLIEDHRIPLITMDFGFAGAGAVQDPADKPGRAHLLSGMLDEGAGEMDSLAFQQRLRELAIRLSFDADRDHFSGRLQTLSANRDEAVRLLRLALREPRFDEDALGRIRAQVLTNLKFDEQDPGKVATRAWFERAFAGHPYARPTMGTPEAIAAITADDLRAALREAMARDNLKIAVVGSISPQELAPLLDEIFGALPPAATLAPVAPATMRVAPEPEIVQMDVPQSVARFGLPAYKRHHEDFYAAFVLNYLIGGGGFASRLMEEVREKRGLAYSVFTYLYPLEQTGLMIGGVGTRNDAVNESMSVIRGVMADIAENGVGEETLENAKQYLIGSYALRFDTSSRIAQQLLGIQLDDLGMDYFDKRNSYIEAVTREDVQRVAEDLLKPDRLLTVIVGNPPAAEEKAAVPRG